CFCRRAFGSYSQLPAHQGVWYVYVQATPPPLCCGLCLPSPRRKMRLPHPAQQCGGQAGDCKSRCEVTANRSIIRLPWNFQRRVEAAARSLLATQQGRTFDFARPVGEPALLPADSVSWRIFKNPVALFIGGVAAVILELAEPTVRSGVWQHSGFRVDPVRRLRRTG